MELVRELAVLQPGSAVFSVYLRRDPRDPANMAATPGWLVELRNGLREVVDAAGEDASRGRRLALRELCGRVEDEVLALEPSERGRGLAWFLTSDEALEPPVHAAVAAPRDARALG